MKYKIKLVEIGKSCGWKIEWHNYATNYNWNERFSAFSLKLNCSFIFLKKNL